MTNPHRKSGINDREYTLLVSIALVITLALIVYTIALRYRPAYSTKYSYMSCPLRIHYGISCLTCGGQRAISYLLNGKLEQAVTSNPYVIFVLLPYTIFQVSCFWWAVVLRAKATDRGGVYIRPLTEWGIGCFVLASGLTFMVARNILEATY